MGQRSFFTLEQIKGSGRFIFWYYQVEKVSVLNDDLTCKKVALKWFGSGRKTPIE